MAPETVIYESKTLSSCWCVCWNRMGSELAVTTGGSKMYIYADGTEGPAARVGMDKAQFNDFGPRFAFDEVHAGRTIRAACYSPCGEFLVSVGFDASTVVWRRDKHAPSHASAHTFSLYTSLEGHENEIKGVAWSNSGKHIATCGRDKTIWIWELVPLQGENNDPEFEPEYETEYEFECAAVLTSHTQDVKSIKWHPKEDVLLSCGYDGSIRLFAALDAMGTDADGEWDLACAILNAHASTAWAMDFDASGEYFASVGADNQLAVYQCIRSTSSTGSQLSCRLVQKIKMCLFEASLRKTLYTVSWNAQTNVIAVGGDDAHVHLVQFDPNAQSLTPLKTIALGEYDINALAWNPVAFSYLAAATDEGKVVLLCIEPAVSA